jgi:hypothetical protein
MNPTEVNSESAFAEKLRSQIEKWNTQLAVLEQKARANGMEAQKEFKIKAEAFRRKKAELEVELVKAEKSGEVAWETLKTGAERAWAELQSAFDEAKAKLN